MVAGRRNTQIAHAKAAAARAPSKSVYTDPSYLDLPPLEPHHRAASLDWQKDFGHILNSSELLTQQQEEHTKAITGQQDAPADAGQHRQLPRKRRSRTPTASSAARAGCRAIAGAAAESGPWIASEPARGLPQDFEMTLAPPFPGRPPAAPRRARFRNNWPAALALFLIGAPRRSPPAAGRCPFWAAGALAALLAATLVVHAWGRHTGGLLVAPAIALLVLMNVFPLLWSFGLTFFSYRTNRAWPPSWVGLENYAKVLTDAEVWDRLHNTVIMVILTVTAQMVVGFLLALLFAKQFPAPARAPDPGADADDACPSSRSAPSSAITTIRPSGWSRRRCACSPASPSS